MGLNDLIRWVFCAGCALVTNNLLFSGAKKPEQECKLVRKGSGEREVKA